MPIQTETNIPDPPPTSTGAQANATERLALAVEALTRALASLKLTVESSQPRHDLAAQDARTRELLERGKAWR